MRSLLFVWQVVSVLALTAGMANAATPGQVPDASLAQLGLSGLSRCRMSRAPTFAARALSR